MGREICNAEILTENFKQHAEELGLALWSVLVAHPFRVHAFLSRALRSTVDLFPSLLFILDKFEKTRLA